MPSGATPSVDGNSKLGPKRRLKRKKVPQGPLPSLVLTATTAVNDGASVADDQSILTSSIADDSLAHTLMQGGQWDGTSSVSSDFGLDYGDSSEAMVVLQRLYDVARSRASEMAEGDGAHGFAIKQHTRMACKLYAAIASVLYSTLGAMQAAKMEEFIVKGGTQVPANLFDLHDWQSVLRLARKCRNEGGSVLVEKNRARMSRIQARTYSGLLEIVVELSERHRKARSTAEEELARLQSALETDKTAILGAVKLVTSELATCRQRLNVARDEASRQKLEHEAATEAAANQAREALERARAEAEKAAADAASAVQRWSQDKEKEQAAARQVEENQAKELQSWAMRLQTAEQALESALRERDEALRDRDEALREREEALASAGSAAKREKATQAVLEGIQLELASALARAALSSSSSGEVAEGDNEGGAAAEGGGIVATNLANLASQLVELRAALARQSVELTQAQEQAQHQEQAQAQIKNLGAALARAEAQLAEERERAQEREVGSSPAFASSPVSPSTQPEAFQASSSDELETMRKAAESARAQFDAQSRELKAVAAEQLQQAQERVQALETRLAESQTKCESQTQAESLAQQQLEAALAREQAMQAKLTVLSGSQGQAQTQADGQPDARTEALSQQLQQAQAQAQAQSEEHARALSKMQAEAEEEVAALSKQLADAQAQLQLQVQAQAQAQAQALQAELPALSARQGTSVSTEQSLQADLAALGLELQRAMQQLAESQAREKGLQDAAAAAATEGAETANVDGDAGAAIAALRVALAGAEARLSAAEAETENARAAQDQVMLAQSRDLESNLKHLQAEAARQVEENQAKELQSWAMRLETAEQALESALRERDEALRDREEALREREEELASAGSTANIERTTLEQSLALDQQQQAAQASNLQLQAALAREQALQAELLAAHAALSQLQSQAQTQADGQPDARTEALSQQLQQAQAQAQAQSEEHARALSKMQAEAEEEVAALSKQLADAQAQLQLQLQAQAQAQAQALQEQAQAQPQTQVSLDTKNQAEQKQLAEALELLASSRQAEASLKKALSASQGHASGATAAEAAARAELAIVNSQLLEKQKHIERLQRKAAELAAEGGDAWSVESPGGSSIASSPSVHQSLREKLGAGPLTVERGITLAQAVARGIIARRRVMHEIAKVQASNNSGVLVAVEGTQQGRTGWYSRHAKHYFYFVIDDDDWLLLAGPLTWDMYLLARNEARLALGLDEDAGVGTAGLPGSLPSSRSGSRAASRGASRGRAETPETGLVGRGGRPSTSSSPVPPKIRLTRCLLVDRVALRAVRVQVDILLGDVRDRDVELGLVRSSLDNYRVQVASDMELLHSKLVQRAVTAESQIVSQAKAFQQRLLDAQALLVSTETALKAANNRAAALAQPFQSPEGAAVAVNMRLSMLAPLNKAAPLANIVRVQALVRGVLDRARLRRHIVALKALSGGVLVASDNTKQGESGWYCAPSGQYFYFVRDQQENWIMASGPLTSIQYEHSVRHPTTGLGGLSGSGAHSSTTARYRKPGVLTRCAFDLVPHHNAMIKSALAGGTGGGGNAASPMQESSWKWNSGVPGADGSYEPALYIQSRTAKLFVAVPLDVAIHLKSDMRLRAGSVSFSDNEEEEE